MMRTIKITTATISNKQKTIVYEDERQEKKWRAKKRWRMKTRKKKGGAGGGGGGGSEEGKSVGKRGEKRKEKKKAKKKGKYMSLQNMACILSSPDTHPGRREDDTSATASRTFSELPPFIQGRDDLMHSP